MSRCAPRAAPPAHAGTVSTCVHDAHDCGAQLLVVHELICVHEVGQMPRVMISAPSKARGNPRARNARDVTISRAPVSPTFLEANTLRSVAVRARPVRQVAASGGWQLRTPPAQRSAKTSPKRALTRCSRRYQACCCCRWVAPSRLALRPGAAAPVCAAASPEPQQRDHQLQPAVLILSWIRHGCLDVWTPARRQGLKVGLSHGSNMA